MTAYYNENYPYAADWLRNLISEGLIAHGVVDTRSIMDVRPNDIHGFTQAHFFAGVGGWSLAARLAGWPDSRPMWSGSCPCQPFSNAGKQKGTADERHLWPVWFPLIDACRPPVVFGEQVAAAVGVSNAGRVGRSATGAVGPSWLDGVYLDLENAGYATRAAIVPACAVDAPHRRDRLWFISSMANRSGLRKRSRSDSAGGDDRSGEFLERPAPRRDDFHNGVGHVAHSHDAERGPISAVRHIDHWQAPGRQQGDGDATERGGAGHVADRNLFSARDGDEQRSGQFGGAGSDSGARHRGGSLAHSHEPRSQRRQLLPECGDERPSRSPSVECHAGSLVDDQGERQREGRTEPEFRSGRDTITNPSSADRSPWSDSEWIIGADQKFRRVKSGVRLLVDGISGRVAIRRSNQQGDSTQEMHIYNRIGALRALGNAIVPQVAAEIIGAYMDCAPF